MLSSWHGEVDDGVYSYIKLSEFFQSVNGKSFKTVEAWPSS